jgi:alpha-beta hydrolase superfamily lysophospholipase
MRGISETMASAPKLHVPLLVMQGGMDKLVNPDATKAFFEAVTEADKEFHSYPEAFHELLNEDQRGGVYADIDNWLKPRLTSGEKPGEELGKSGNE